MTTITVTGRADWDEALAAYATSQRAAGRAAGTVKLHGHYLRMLARMSAGPGPWDVTRGDLEALLGREGWEPETRKSCRGALRGFYRWAYGMALVDDDPAAGLPPVKVPPALPRPTPEHLVRQLLAADDVRLAFMGLLAAYAGLRRGEIARVHRGDYEGDGYGGTLRVKGKGGKIRDVTIVDRRLAMLLDRCDGWAFPSTSTGSHLSVGHVGRLLSAAMPQGWTAHTLRHRMATRGYAGTRDLLAVGAMLGHSRPETTQRYVLLPDDAVRAVALAAAG